MTSEELKSAFVAGTPVEHNGIIYKRISALIYRANEKNELRVQVELEDKNTNSITIAESNQVKERRE